MTRHDGGNNSKGFTLVEVMVALIVVAVALPALLSQVMTMMDGTGAVREKTIAHWVAQNEYVRMQLQRRISGELLTGEEHGTKEMVGLQWHWQVGSESTAVDGLRRLTISVGREEGSPLVVLVGFIDD